MIIPPTPNDLRFITKDILNDTPKNIFELNQY